MTDDPFTHKLECEHCGRTFTSKRKDAKYCPDEPGRHCRVDAHRAKKEHKKLPKKERARCELCNKTYWTDLPTRAMYCSRKCAYRAAYLRRPEGGTE